MLTPKNKFLERIRENPDLQDDTKVAIKLPRMSFEITAITYDATRQLAKIGNFTTTASDGSVTKRQKFFNHVPYNINFQLNVYAKNQDDALQIVEQILPFFQPDYTVTLNDNTDMGTTRDVPIVLTNVTYEDNYEADFLTRRSIIYTLSFTAKFYLYGPVTDQKVIKTVQVDQYTDVQVNTPKREQRYSVAPNPATADADDDFGFNETTSFFQDAKNYDETTGTDTDDA